MSALRIQVLEAFKSLHKTRKLVFESDSYALEQARLKINQEYRKCKDVSDIEKIKELVALSKAVENELKTTVVQVKQVKPGLYEANIRQETVKLDNVPFKECCSENNIAENTQQVKCTK